jgi:hypothetical protein
MSKPMKKCKTKGAAPQAKTKHFLNTAKHAKLYFAHAQPVKRVNSIDFGWRLNTFAGLFSKSWRQRISK